MSDNLERITGNVSLKRYQGTEYIGAYSLNDGAKPILTIASLWHGDLTLGGGRKEHHVLIKFKEKSVPGVEEVKPMIVNSTNRKTLKKLYGGDTAEILEGKRIQLFIDPKVRDPDGGGFTEGLRIRPIVVDDAPPQGAPKVFICQDCKNPISDFQGAPAAHIAIESNKKYGRQLCYDCTMKAKADAEVPKEPEQKGAEPDAADAPKLPFDI